MLFFFRCSLPYSSIPTFPLPGKYAYSSKHSDYRILRSIHFSQMGIPDVDCSKAAALL